MKKITTLLLITLFSLSFLACSSAESEYLEIVRAQTKEMNEFTPKMKKWLDDSEAKIKAGDAKSIDLNPPFKEEFEKSANATKEKLEAWKSDNADLFAKWDDKEKTEDIPEEVKKANEELMKAVLSLFGLAMREEAVEEAVKAAKNN